MAAVKNEKIAISHKSILMKFVLLMHIDRLDTTGQNSEDFIMQDGRQKIEKAQYLCTRLTNFAEIWYNYADGSRFENRKNYDIAKTV